MIRQKNDTPSVHTKNVRIAEIVSSSRYHLHIKKKQMWNVFIMLSYSIRRHFSGILKFCDSVRQKLTIVVTTLHGLFTLAQASVISQASAYFFPIRLQLTIVSTFFCCLDFV